MGQQTHFLPRRLIGKDEAAACTALITRCNESGIELRYGGEAQCAYEEAFANFHGGGFATLVSSGTAALYSLLGALELEVPGEVVVPAITDAGGVMPVPLRNLVPVVADVAPSQLNISASEVEAVLTPWTRAIVVAHIGGMPAEIEELRELATSRNLPLIEDCSQAHGATLGDRMVGTFGDAAIFSTMSGKHHATGGQGGVVLTREKELHRRVRQHVDRGKCSTVQGGHNLCALNLNGNDLAAAIGVEQIRKLPRILAQRRLLAEQLIQTLGDLRILRVDRPRPLVNAAWWFVRLVIHVNNLKISRDAVVAELRAAGVPAGVWADTPFRQSWFLERRVFPPTKLPWELSGYRGPYANATFSCANADKASAESVMLYIHEGWSQSDVLEVCSVLKDLELTQSRSESAQGL